MSEHNKNFYSLEEVERCLEANKDFQDGEEIYYFIGALRYVYDENKRLNNIINKLEKYINEEYIYDELGMKIFDASKLQDKLQELKRSDKE